MFLKQSKNKPIEDGLFLSWLVHWEGWCTGSRRERLLKVVRVSSFSVFTLNNKPMFFPSPSLSAHPFGSSVDFLLPLLLFSDSSSSVLLSPQTRRHRHLPPSPPLPPLPRTTLPRTTLPQTLSTSSTSSQGTPFFSWRELGLLAPPMPSCSDQIFYMTP